MILTITERQNDSIIDIQASDCMLPALYERDFQTNK